MYKYRKPEEKIQSRIETIITNGLGFTRNKLTLVDSLDPIQGKLCQMELSNKSLSYSTLNSIMKVESDNVFRNSISRRISTYHVSKDNTGGTIIYSPKLLSNSGNVIFDKNITGYGGMHIVYNSREEIGYSTFD